MNEWKPGGGTPYWLRVIVVVVTILLMTCYLIYFLSSIGAIDRIAH